jgi:hypothetical protein
MQGNLEIRMTADQTKQLDEEQAHHLQGSNTSIFFLSLYQ